MGSLWAVAVLLFELNIPFILENICVTMSVCFLDGDLWNKITFSSFKAFKYACFSSDLANVDGRYLCGADWRVTRWVGEWLARPDGQLLLLLGGHNLLGNCNTHKKTLISFFYIISFPMVLLSLITAELSTTHTGLINTPHQCRERQLGKNPSSSLLIGCL